MARVFAAVLVVVLLAGFGVSTAEAGFRSPESPVRNVYAYCGDRSSELASGLPRDSATARQFSDVESPHDSLRMFLAQYRN
jgi:hypothetical protein